ncbi:MAG: hypothetical protein HY547_05990 [Elusimicrobia bacterium]|nr:hypothetical protein [Elusimicrobiota bacterium]
MSGAVIGGALGAFLGIFSAITAGGGLALTALLFYGLIAAGAWMGGATGAVIDLMADSNDISQNSKSSPSSAKKASKDDDEPKGRNKGCIPERPTPRKPDPIDRRNPRDRF